jgi:hypothetical protein
MMAIEAAGDGEGKERHFHGGKMSDAICVRWEKIRQQQDTCRQKRSAFTTCQDFF